MIELLSGSGISSPSAISSCSIALLLTRDSFSLSASAFCRSIEPAVGKSTETGLCTLRTRCFRAKHGDTAIKKHSRMSIFLTLLFYHAPPWKVNLFSLRLAAHERCGAAQALLESLQQLSPSLLRALREMLQ